MISSQHSNTYLPDISAMRSRSTGQYKFYSKLTKRLLQNSDVWKYEESITDQSIYTIINS